ncbi:uncharacterized protein LOC128882286 isoform X2 [Hylaeus volcanicus]|uniref:uncharacterized protein LOC128882286 isoform X2 n=1 Tax=Hylaeus volcanicus TaxID=313075 RepID=UPI0023B863E3|nr:uncharacterized protein LOC128882286 isoform X2 [Hylaeus volcanicus]
MVSIRLLPAFVFIISVSFNYASASHSIPYFSTPTLRELSSYYVLNNKNECFRTTIPSDKRYIGGTGTDEFIRYLQRTPCVPYIKTPSHMTRNEVYEKLLLIVKKEQEEDMERGIDLNIDRGRRLEDEWFQNEEEKLKKEALRQEQDEALRKKKLRQEIAWDETTDLEKGLDTESAGLLTNLENIMTRQSNLSTEELQAFNIIKEKKLCPSFKVLYERSC